MSTKTTKAFGTEASTAPLKNLSISRRSVEPHDIEIDILYCGICHSDLHAVHNDWGFTTYPVVPGHEIIGRVTRVGGNVTKFRVGEV